MFSVSTSFIDRRKEELNFDNAPSQKTSTVNDYLAERSIIIMPHSACSLNLVPSDFWLFGFINQQQFSDEKSLKRAVTETLENIPEDIYRKTFENSIERMKLYKVSW